MSLAEYQPDTRVIPFKGGSFEVSGLSLPDFTKLLRAHFTDLEAMFDLGKSVVGGKADISDDDVMKIVIALVEEVPTLVASIIATASGESDPRAVENAARLPFPMQVKTLFEIADVTFAEVGGVKNGIESVVGLVKNQPESLKKILTTPT